MTQQAGDVVSVCRWSLILTQMMKTVLVCRWSPDSTGRWWWHCVCVQKKSHPNSGDDDSVPIQVKSWLHRQVMMMFVCRWSLTLTQVMVTCVSVQVKSWLHRQVVMMFVCVQVESHPNSQVMMNVAKNLRVERDREKRVAAQKQEQMTNVGRAVWHFFRSCFWLVCKIKCVLWSVLHDPFGCEAPA